MKTDHNLNIDAGHTMIKTNGLAGRTIHPLRIAGAHLAALVLALGTAHAAGTAQRGFEVPEQAADALAKAWHDNSKPELLVIFGPAGMKLVSSGDPVAENTARAKLAEEYDAAHRIEDIDAQKARLILGTGEFPYPIPLVKTGELWYFDTKAGEQEIIDRRIGRNELNAIRVCRTYVEAQREYAAIAPGNDKHAYASKVISGDGKHDGLYWPAAEGEPQSPLGPLFAKAAAEGYGSAGKVSIEPYHGYYYRILAEQGKDAHGSAAPGRGAKGFALVAYPAKYGDSGIMSFIVNQHGIVFEKNLGPDSAQIARNMPTYNPDRSWKPVAQD